MIFYVLTKIVNQCLTIIVRCLTNVVNLCLTTIVNWVKFVKHNFTHRPFGVWVLLMWVVPIQNNVSLNYNPLFQGKTLWLHPCRLIHEFIYFYVLGDIYFYLFVAVPNNLFRLPMYPWWGVLLMWVVPIQNNISLNYNPLFQRKTLWLHPCRLIHEFIYFYV